MDTSTVAFKWHELQYHIVTAVSDLRGIMAALIGGEVTSCVLAGENAADESVSILNHPMATLVLADGETHRFFVPER
ncbi:hypothetical protein ASC97_18600 [Rhizobium sp. Root1203]|uniref:hypothetical protein n=1 Tax=Rhizobium sp. Root1203 TaxID=1736427 RepID=UPI00070F3FCA|nr:hypothetical protein ASC97_18600 [Rhizobium sp. Root1203]